MWPALALALLFVLPALTGAGGAAHAAVLVSNINEPKSGAGHLSRYDQAQAFTTGPNSAGYTLTSIELRMALFGFGDKAVFSISINANNNGAPGRNLGTLTQPSSLVVGINKFTHTGISLSANTTYFVVIDVSTGGTGEFENTVSDSETGKTDWFIADDSLERDSRETGSWRTIRRAKRIRINGSTGDAPTFGSTITPQSYTQNMQIPELTLPQATGGDGMLRYTLDGTLPAGLSYDSTNRKITGTPTGTQAATTYTWKATDTDGDSASLTFTIAVTAANRAPAFGSASYKFNLAENADGSTTPVSVGTVSATDPDTGDTVSYSITAGNTGSKFAIDSSTGAITYTGEGENYEGFTDPATAFSLTVRASDGTAHREVTVTVAVTDVTETATVTISGLADASVAENTAYSATATASGGIGTVTWSKEGTDAADFTLNASTGALAMVARDYEHPVDGNTDNDYEVTVKATDADGNTATQAITVTVTDVDEAPGKPAQPSVSPTQNSTTSLDVSWTVPANTGPAIQHYDLRYRAGTSGGWTDGPQDVTTTSTPIASLQAGTSYQVQVRATNAEGDSDWSDSGSGTTSTPTNTPPVFDSASYTFDLAENADGSTTPVSLGTVTATDADTGDTVSYSITAGNTDSKFAIGGSDGTLTYTGGGENYEGFTDPTTAFSLTVRASDGTAHSEVTVTVAVTDANEPPGKPAAPAVSPTTDSTTGLDVSWRAPANTGRPAIQHYDLRYRAGTSGGWTDGPQDVTTTSASIASLQAGTSYQVQVRATNAEGNGAWSDSGSGTTTAADRVPSFGATISDQTYTQHTQIAALILPDATGGDGPLRYTLIGTLPTGLHFDENNHRITGTPTVPTPPDICIWKATDRDGDSAELTFTIEVLGADSPEPLGVTLDEASVTVTEAGGEASYRVVLETPPSGIVTVAVASSSDSAARVRPAVLTFTRVNWNRPRLVTVTGVNDDVDNPGDARRATITHTGVGGDYDGVAMPSVTVIVTDDDTAGVTLSKASVTVAERGDEATYTVVLDTKPVGPVTVTPTSQAPAVVTVSGALTFTPANWNEPQPVTVRADAAATAGQMATITHGVAGYGDVTAAPVTVTVVGARPAPLPRAWLSRFGRTVGTHMTDVMGARLRAPAGLDSHVTVGGYRLPLRASRSSRGAALLEGLAGLLGLGPGGPGRPEAAFGGWEPDSRRDPSRPVHLDLRRLLVGSSFRLNLGAGEADGASPRLTAWGRVAGTRFDGRDGALALDGDVLTGTVGVDGAWARWLAGVAVSHSRGDGSYSQPGTPARGTLDHTLTSLHPYLRYQMTDRLDVWGLLGYGWGEVTLAPATGTTVETDTTLVMGAVGSRGVLLTAAEHKGFELATRTDLMLTRMTSEEGTGLAAKDADAHRLRLILEGSRGLTWTEGRRLTPTVQVGLRHDWGDAETGFGLEVGGQVQYTDPTLGLTVAGAARTLLAHADSAYDEWGASGLVRLAPGAGGRGLALTLVPAWGATASGVEALWTRQSTAGLAPPDRQGQLGGRVNAEVGYGFAPFAMGVLTPYAGTVLATGAERTYRVGTRWRLMGGWATGLEVNVEGQRQEAGGGARPVNQGLQFQAAWGF